MTRAKTQPICRKHELHLGVYNPEQRTVLPRSVTEKIVDLRIHNNHFSVIREPAQVIFPDAIEELEEDFKNESNETTDDFVRQVVEYKFPLIYEKNYKFSVFAFDRETCNVGNPLYCEAYATGVYLPNRLYESFNGDLTERNYKLNEKMFMCSTVKTVTLH